MCVFVMMGSEASTDVIPIFENMFFRPWTAIDARTYELLVSIKRRLH